MGGLDDTVAATDPAERPSAAGIVVDALIGKRYRITRYLGGGGMGNVYAAVDTELGEPVAIKVLRRELRDDAVERFRGEVRLQRRITHRNVARIFDIGEHDGERLLTMELVDGESLAARLVRLGRMPLQELRAVATDILAGLAAAHGAGVIHLDLKPSNVLLARDGRAVIADFGIARAGFGQPGEIAGTPAYMAPEQHVGDGDLDARTDLYAFGVMLFELATGRRPFSGTTLAQLAAGKATPPDPSELAAELPPAVIAVIQRCLAPVRADRPASAEEVSAALERALRDTAATAPLAGPGAATTATVAVLPMTAAPGDEYLANGLAEDLADALSRSPGLRVLPATAVRGLAATGVAAGAALGVDHVVEGSVRRSGDILRVAVRLVAVRDGFQIWAERRDSGEADLLATGDDLAAGLARALSTVVERRDEVDPRAVDLYLRARHHLRGFWSVPIQQAIALLEEAAIAGPSSPSIIASLASARVRHWMLVGTTEAGAAAVRAAEQAIAVGPFHGEARYSRAQLRINSGDLVGGAADLAAAITLAPLLPEAHYTAGLLLCELGHHDEGQRRFAHCLELDPGMATLVQSDRSRIAMLRGDAAGAEALLAGLDVAGVAPTVSRLVTLFHARFAMWRRDRATALAIIFAQPTATSTLVDDLMEAIRTMVVTGSVDEASWRAQLERNDDPGRPLRARLVQIQLLAEVAMTDDNVELAMVGLTRLATLGLFDIEWLTRCPLWQPLAGDPRYAAIVSQVAGRANQIAEAYHGALTGR